MIERDELTAAVLMEEAAAERARGPERAQALARVRAMLRIRHELPDGFRIERVRGPEEGDRDRGLELRLCDERRRPPRVVGSVARRRIGESKLTWTPGQLCDIEAAEAFAVVLRLAATDAEGR